MKKMVVCFFVLMAALGVQAQNIINSEKNSPVTQPIHVDSVSIHHQNQVNSISSDKLNPNGGVIDTKGSQQPVQSMDDKKVLIINSEKKQPD